MVPNSFRDTAGDGCGQEIGDPDGDLIPNEPIDHNCQDYAPGAVSLDTDGNAFYSNRTDDPYYSEIRSRPQNQDLGNYEGFDHHAGIFLAFDPDGDGSFDGTGTIGTVWSVEGNISDHVKIMHRPTDSTLINGYGKLDLTMFQ